VPPIRASGMLTVTPRIGCFFASSARPARRPAVPAVAGPAATRSAADRAIAPPTRPPRFEVRTGVPFLPRAPVAVRPAAGLRNPQDGTRETPARAARQRTAHAQAIEIAAGVALEVDDRRRLVARRLRADAAARDRAALEVEHVQLHARGRRQPVPQQRRR